MQAMHPGQRAIRFVDEDALFACERGHVQISAVMAIDGGMQTVA